MRLNSKKGTQRLKDQSLDTAVGKQSPHAFLRASSRDSDVISQTKDGLSATQERTPFAQTTQLTTDKIIKVDVKSVAVDSYGNQFPLSSSDKIVPGGDKPLLRQSRASERSLCSIVALVGDKMSPQKTRQSQVSTVSIGQQFGGLQSTGQRAFHGMKRSERKKQESIRGSNDSIKLSHHSSPDCPLTPAEVTVQQRTAQIAKQNDRQKVRKGPAQIRDSRTRPLGLSVDKTVLQNRQLVGQPQSSRFCQCGLMEDRDIHSDTVLPVLSDAAQGMAGDQNLGETEPGICPRCLNPLRKGRHAPRHSIAVGYSNPQSHRDERGDSLHSLPVAVNSGRALSPRDGTLLTELGVPADRSANLMFTSSHPDNLNSQRRPANTDLVALMSEKKSYPSKIGQRTISPGGTSGELTGRLPDSISRAENTARQNNRVFPVCRFGDQPYERDLHTATLAVGSGEESKVSETQQNDYTDEVDGFQMMQSPQFLAREDVTGGGPTPQIQTVVVKHSNALADGGEVSVKTHQLAQDDEDKERRFRMSFTDNAMNQTARRDTIQLGDDKATSHLRTYSSMNPLPSPKDPSHMAMKDAAKRKNQPPTGPRSPAASREATRAAAKFGKVAIHAADNASKGIQACSEEFDPSKTTSVAPSKQVVGRGVDVVTRRPDNGDLSRNGAAAARIPSDFHAFQQLAVTTDLQPDLRPSRGANSSTTQPAVVGTAQGLERNTTGGSGVSPLALMDAMGQQRPAQGRYSKLGEGSLNDPTRPPVLHVHRQHSQRSFDLQVSPELTHLKRYLLEDGALREDRLPKVTDLDRMILQQRALLRQLEVGYSIDHFMSQKYAKKVRDNLRALERERGQKGRQQATTSQVYVSAQDFPHQTQDRGMSAAHGTMVTLERGEDAFRSSSGGRRTGSRNDQQEAEFFQTRSTRKSFMDQLADETLAQDTSRRDSERAAAKKLELKPSHLMSQTIQERRDTPTNEMSQTQEPVVSSQPRWHALLTQYNQKRAAASHVAKLGAWQRKKRMADANVDTMITMNLKAKQVDLQARPKAQASMSRNRSGAADSPEPTPANGHLHSFEIRNPSDALTMNAQSSVRGDGTPIQGHQPPIMSFRRTLEQLDSLNSIEGLPHAAGSNANSTMMRSVVTIPKPEPAPDASHLEQRSRSQPEIQDTGLNKDASLEGNSLEDILYGSSKQIDMQMASQAKRQVVKLGRQQPEKPQNGSQATPPRGRGAITIQKVTAPLKAMRQSLHLPSHRMDSVFGSQDSMSSGGGMSPAKRKQIRDTAAVECSRHSQGETQRSWLASAIPVNRYNQKNTVIFSKKASQQTDRQKAIASRNYARGKAQILQSYEGFKKQRRMGAPTVAQAHNDIISRRNARHASMEGIISGQQQMATTLYGDYSRRDELDNIVTRVHHQLELTGELTGNDLVSRRHSNAIYADEPSVRKKWSDALPAAPKQPAFRLKGANSPSANMYSSQVIETRRSPRDSDLKRPAENTHRDLTNVKNKDAKKQSVNISMVFSEAQKAQSMVSAQISPTTMMPNSSKRGGLVDQSHASSMLAPSPASKAQFQALERLSLPIIRLSQPTEESQRALGATLQMTASVASGPSQTGFAAGLRNVRLKSKIGSPSAHAAASSAFADRSQLRELADQLNVISNKQLNVARSRLAFREQIERRLSVPVTQAALPETREENVETGSDYQITQPTRRVDIELSGRSTNRGATQRAVDDSSEKVRDLVKSGGLSAWEQPILRVHHDSKDNEARRLQLKQLRVTNGQITLSAQANAGTSRRVNESRGPFMTIRQKKGGGWRNTHRVLPSDVTNKEVQPEKKSSRYKTIQVNQMGKTATVINGTQTNDLAVNHKTASERATKESQGPNDRTRGLLGSGFRILLDETEYNRSQPAEGEDALTAHQHDDDAPVPRMLPSDLSNNSESVSPRQGQKIGPRIYASVKAKHKGKIALKGTPAKADPDSTGLRSVLPRAGASGQVVMPVMMITPSGKNTSPRKLDSSPQVLPLMSSRAAENFLYKRYRHYTNQRFQTIA